MDLVLLVLLHDLGDALLVCETHEAETAGATSHAIRLDDGVPDPAELLEVMHEVLTGGLLAEAANEDFVDLHIHGGVRGLPLA